MADNAVGVSCLPSAAASQPLQLLVAEVEPLDASVSALAAPAETPDPAKACALPALPVTPASAIPASAAALVLSAAVVRGVSGHSALLPAAAASAAGVGTAVAAAVSAVPWYSSRHSSLSSPTASRPGSSAAQTAASLGDQTLLAGAGTAVAVAACSAAAPAAAGAWRAGSSGT